MALGATGGFVAGAIIGKLLLDKSGWNQSVKEVGKDEQAMKGMSDRTAKNIGNIGKAMTIAGAAIVGGLTMAASHFAKTGDAIDDMAKRTGFSHERLSELSFMASRCGGSIGGLEKGVKKMQKTIYDAGKGLSTATDAFKTLGISFENIKNLSPEEQFEKLTTALANLEDPTVRAAVAQEVFGRAGTELLPMLAEGTAGMATLRKEAHDLGVVFDKEAAESASKLDDAGVNLKASLSGLSLTIGGALAPTLTGLKNGLADVISKFSQWAKEHPVLARGLTLVVGGLGTLLTLGGSVALLLPRLVQGFQMMAPVLPGIASSLGKIGAVGVAAFIGWKIGERIGEIKILGDTINNHLIKAFEGLTDKIVGSGTAFVAGEGHAAALEKRQRLLAEASALAGEDITSVHEALEILGKRLNSSTPATDDQTEAVKRLIPKLKEVDTEFVQLYKDLGAGLITIDEFNARLGKTSLAAYNLARAIKEAPIAEALEDEIESYMTILDSMPSATASVMESVGITIFNEAGELKQVNEETAVAVKSFWDETADGLKTKWSDLFGEWIKSGDIFKGDFKGLMDGILTIATDTFGQMASKFMSEFIDSIISGAADAGKSIASNIASSVGGKGSDSIAGAFKNVGGAASSLLSTLGGISSIVTAVASVANLFKKGGLDSTSKWHLEHIWMNTKETRDYLFIEQWKMLSFAELQRQDMNTSLWNANEKLGKIRSRLTDINRDTGRMIRLLGDIAKGAGGGGKGKTGTAPWGGHPKGQFGYVSTASELIQTHGTPRRPEYIIPYDNLSELITGVGRLRNDRRTEVMVPVTVNINGNVMNDRDFTRNRIIPEIIKAVRSNAMKTDLKRALGVP